MRSTPSAIALAGLLLCKLAFAAPVVDQSYLPSTGVGYNIGFSGDVPIGQEFTPTLTGLDFVDLFIADVGFGPNPGANFQVNIRSGGISGTILGTSAIAFVPNDLNQGIASYASFATTRFAFDSTVALTPASTYVIEVTQDPSSAGLNFIMYGGPTTGSTYAGGRAIVNGSALEGFDFAFREGLLDTAVVPEPSTAALVALALVALGGAGRRRQQPAVLQG